MQARQDQRSDDRDLCRRKAIDYFNDSRNRIEQDTLVFIMTAIRLYSASLSFARLLSHTEHARQRAFSFLNCRTVL